MCHVWHISIGTKCKGTFDESTADNLHTNTFSITSKIMKMNKRITCNAGIYHKGWLIRKGFINRPYYKYIIINPKSNDYSQSSVICTDQYFSSSPTFKGILELLNFEMERNPNFPHLLEISVLKELQYQYK